MTILRSGVAAVFAVAGVACAQPTPRPDLIGPELGQSTAPGPSDPTLPPPDAAGVPPVGTGAIALRPGAIQPGPGGVTPTAADRSSTTTPENPEGAYITPQDTTPIVGTVIAPLIPATPAAPPPSSTPSTPTFASPLPALGSNYRPI